MSTEFKQESYTYEIMGIVQVTASNKEEADRMIKTYTNLMNNGTYAQGRAYVTVTDFRVEKVTKTS